MTEGIYILHGLPVVPGNLPSAFNWPVVFNHPIHPFTVIVDPAFTAAALLIAYPVEPQVIAVPPEGLDKRKGQQCPTIC